jgi:hypothetical protein
VKEPEPFLSVAAKRSRLRTVPGTSSFGAVPEIVTGVPAFVLCRERVAVAPQPATLAVRVKPAFSSCLAVRVTAELDPFGAAVPVPVVVNWNWKPISSGEVPVVE